MRTCWLISIRWSDTDRELGLFTDTSFSGTQEGALRDVAELMAQSVPDLDLKDGAAVDQFVERAIDRLESVSETTAQMAVDISNVFCDELFPDGRRREIDLNALAALLAEHRERVLKPVA